MLLKADEHAKGKAYVPYDEKEWSELAYVCHLRS